MGKSPQNPKKHHANHHYSHRLQRDHQHTRRGQRIDKKLLDFLTNHTLIDENNRTEELQAITPDGNIHQWVNLTLEPERDHWKILTCHALGKAFIKPNVEIEPDTIREYPYPEDIPQHIKDICTQYEKETQTTNCNLLETALKLHAFWVTDTGNPKDLLNPEQAFKRLQEITPPEEQIKLENEVTFTRKSKGLTLHIPYANVIKAINTNSFKAMLTTEIHQTASLMEKASRKLETILGLRDSTQDIQGKPAQISPVEIMELIEQHLQQNHDLEQANREPEPITPDVTLI